MPGAVRRRQLACGLLLAALAAPVRAAAGVPAWDPGDVEAAERYRALERERALRFRAAAEDRGGEPRRGERARRDRGSRAEEPRWHLERERAEPVDRNAPLLEPWVTRLARALAEAVLRAFVAAAHDAWLSLRDAFHDWLEDAWARERPAWTSGDWPSRK